MFSEMSVRALLSAVIFTAAATGRPSPAAAFERGVQDNAVMLHESGMSHRQFFLHARKLRAETIQVDVTYHGWRSRGGAFFDHAVDAARKAGFRIRLRLMPSPTWEPQTWLSATRYHPQRMRRWARRVARHFGRRVARYTIGNEPNHPKFQVTRDPCTYRALYEWGRRGIREAHPRRRRGELRIYAGGTVASSTVEQWWRTLRRCAPVFNRRLRTAGLMHHPYQNWSIPPRRRLDEPSWGIGSIERCVRFARRQFRVPCHVSEYGVPATHPRQRAHLREAIRRARRAKAGGFVLYQIVKSYRGWNTGFIRPDPWRPQ